jgi:hypothetical protein
LKEYDSDINAAKYSGLSVSWFRKRRVLGLPPIYIKVSRRVLYSRTEIDRFLAEHAVTPGTGRPGAEQD